MASLHLAVSEVVSAGSTYGSAFGDPEERDEADQEEDENANGLFTNTSRTWRATGKCESVVNGKGHPCVPLRKRKSACVDEYTSSTTFSELVPNQSSMDTVVSNEAPIQTQFLYTCGVCRKPYTYKGCVETHEAKCVESTPWISTKSPKKKAHTNRST
jgi:hypothetical protein